ncbi:unnamed protein product, partial [Brassica rapa subsp. trilocularis]
MALRFMTQTPLLFVFLFLIVSLFPKNLQHLGCDPLAFTLPRDLIGVFKGKQGSDGDINDVGTDKDDGGMDKAEIQRSLEFLRVDGGDEGDVCAEIRVNLEGEKRREEDNP